MFASGLSCLGLMELDVRVTVLFRIGFANDGRQQREHALPIEEHRVVVANEKVINGGPEKLNPRLCIALELLERSRHGTRVFVCDGHRMEDFPNNDFVLFLESGPHVLQVSPPT